MVDVQTISMVFGGLSVGVAAIFYSVNIINQYRTRKTQLFLEFHNKIWGNIENVKLGQEILQMKWDSPEDFYSKFDSSVDLESYGKRYTRWQTYNALGYLMKKNLIDRETTYHLIGGTWAMWTWEKFKSIILDTRKRWNLPDAFIWMEYLSNEMEKGAKKRGHLPEVPSNFGSFEEIK